MTAQLRLQEERHLEKARQQQYDKRKGNAPPPPNDPVQRYQQGEYINRRSDQPQHRKIQIRPGWTNGASSVTIMAAPVATERISITPLNTLPGKLSDVSGKHRVCNRRNTPCSSINSGSPLCVSNNRAAGIPTTYRRHGRSGRHRPSGPKCRRKVRSRHTRPRTTWLSSESAE